MQYIERINRITACELKRGNKVSILMFKIPYLMVAHESDDWRPAVVAGPSHQERCARWAQSLLVD